MTFKKKVERDPVEMIKRGYEITRVNNLKKGNIDVENETALEARRRKYLE
jgi:hypothetical protein